MVAVFCLFVYAGLIHNGLVNGALVGVSTEVRRNLGRAGQRQPHTVAAAAGSTVGTAAHADHAKEEAEMSPEEADAEWKDTQRKVMSLPDLVPKTIVQMEKSFYTFLPGWKYQQDTAVSAVLTIVVSLMCLGMYMNKFYTNDRSTSLSRWEAQMKDLQQECADDVEPDIIIVMHHPDYAYEDGGLEVAREQFGRVLCSSESRTLFPRLYDAQQKSLDAKESHIRNAEKVITNKAMIANKSLSSFKEARLAILEDAYSVLEKFGFSRTAFSSIDGDELFVCITLRRRAAINYYIARDSMPLAVREDVVLKLQDDNKMVVMDFMDDACSAPLVPYDQNLCKVLAQRNIAKSDRETETYRSHKRAGRSTCLSSRDCVGVIQDEMLEVVDLDAAVDEQIIVNWYPVHKTSDVACLKAMWANLSNITDFSFVQPITYIKEYFGARIGFYFAFNGVMCKALTMILTVAALWLCAVLVVKHVFGSDFINQRQVIGFSIALCVWSKIANTMWLREESFFLELWNMRHINTTVERCRPKFTGELQPSLLNANIMEKQYPHNLAVLRRLASNFLTLLFCALVGIVIWTWMIMFKGNMGVISSIILSVVIKIFQLIFTRVVAVLVEFENHKFQQDWYNSYLVKLFSFEYINNFSAFFFLTITNANRQDEKCKVDPDACKEETLEIVRQQVSMTLFILGACAIIGVLLNIAIVKFKFWWEDRQYRQTFNRDPPQRSSHEEQSKLAKLDDATEVQAMVTLMTSLGFALHFGGVAPLSLLFSFVVFVAQMRTFAILLCEAAQRVWPHKSQGIGEWNNIVKFLMTSGVLYTAFLFVAYGQAFAGAQLLAKMTGFLIFCFFVFGIWNVIDICYPPQDVAEVLLTKRRNYVKKLLAELEHKDDLVEHHETDSDAPVEVEEAFSARSWNLLSGRPQSRRSERS